MKQFGPPAFMIGLLVAIIAGLVPDAAPAAMVAMLLGLLGIIVGFLNIADKEVQLFLVAAIALLVSAAGLVSVFAGVQTLGPIVEAILRNVVVFVAPAAAVVSLKALYVCSKE